MKIVSSEDLVEQYTQSITEAMNQLLDTASFNSPEADTAVFLPQNTSAHKSTVVASATLKTSLTNCTGALTSAAAHLKQADDTLAKCIA